jgi:hypothetical protein
VERLSRLSLEAISISTGRCAFFFDDPNWVAKLLMGSLFYMLAVSLIGGFFLAGYMMELMRRSARGERYPLPEWENLGDMFVKGAAVMAVYLVLILPVMVLFIVPMVAMSALSEGEDPPAALGLAVVLLMIVLVVYYIAFLCYFPAAMVRMAMERRFSAACEFSENFEFLKRNIINCILAIVCYMLASLISQFGMILCCVGIMPAVFWAVCVGAYSLGEVALRDSARSVGVP